MQFYHMAKWRFDCFQFINLIKKFVFPRSLQLNLHAGLACLNRTPWPLPNQMRLHLQTKQLIQADEGGLAKPSIANVAGREQTDQSCVCQVK